MDLSSASALARVDVRNRIGAAEVSLEAMSAHGAELAALVKGTSEGLGMRSRMADYGLEGASRVYTDATAAKGAAVRHTHS